MSGEFVFTVSDGTAKPAAPAQAAAREARARRASVPQRLVDHQVFGEGQSLRIVVPAGVGEDREAIGG